MRLLPKAEIPWWQAHPEHGFDWKAYRAREKEMIKRGDFRALSDLHDAIDEDELLRAYDARRLDDIKWADGKMKELQNPESFKVMHGEGKKMPPNPWKQRSPRVVLDDPAFAPKQARVAGNPWALAAALLLAPSEIGEEDYTDRGQWGGEK